MMDQKVYKTYTELTNIIVRISNGSPQGKEHALLVNAHVDSTLMTPGAADDAMPVGVMLECMRVLLADATWEPSTAVIFRTSLFSNSASDAFVLNSVWQFSITLKNRYRTLPISSPPGTTSPTRLCPFLLSMVVLLLICLIKSVRAVINLEAAGTTGPELLFQATSEEMIQAYAKVPYPFGTVIAADIFKTGVMLSE
jgi:Zn-dependent M28 family amino/carboxypeptidase